MWPGRRVRQVQVSGPGSVNAQAGGDTGDRTRDYRILAGTVIMHLNPPRAAKAPVLASAVRRLADYVEGLPCSCGPGATPGEDAQCGRCAALGQISRKPVHRG